jgi:hypothetical protein
MGDSNLFEKRNDIMKKINGILTPTLKGEATEDSKLFI